MARIQITGLTTKPSPLASTDLFALDDKNSVSYKATGTMIGDLVVLLQAGVGLQAYDAALQSISGLTTSANKMIYTTASDTYAVTDLTAFARTLLDDATAAAGRATLGISAGILSWVEVTGTTQAMAVNTGYIANNASIVTFTAPATWAIGDALAIIGKGAGGWGMMFNSGQLARIGSMATTATTGSLASSNRYDSVNFIATTANTTLTHLGGPQGQINFDTL